MKDSVRKRGTTWSYRVDFGRSTDGKRNQIEKGGYKTKKEADKALNDVLFQYNNTGDYVENQKIVFQDVYNEFMQTEAKANGSYCNIIKIRIAVKTEMYDKISLNRNTDF